MDYTQKDVDAAEARIRVECPRALVQRMDYDWSLFAARADTKEEFIVFQCGINGRSTIIGDVDSIIRALNKPTN